MSGGRRVAGPTHGGAVAAILRWPALLVEIRRVCRIRPRMTIDRNLRVAIEVIEQHILFGDLVLVRGHLSSKDTQTRVAVPLWQIAEHLIIGAVLLDDIDDVLDG